MADSKAVRGSKAARPLSPHLQIYKMPISMLMSIVHRITGGALYFGTILVAVLLVAAAMGREEFDTVSGLLGSWPGLVVLIGYTWALLHHLAGGIRHFIWDAGRGFDIPSVDLLSWGSIGFSATATIAIWLYVWLAGGSAP